MSNRVFAVIENNTVVNIIVDPGAEELAANPNKYIEFTDGWDFDNGIDGAEFFPKPEIESK